MNDIENGYVKLYRSFLQWEWHDNEYMLTVFLHCLLLANWKTKRWHGQVIKRGSFVSSYGKLASACGIAVNTCRKCCKQLESTGELTIQSTRQFTIFTVNNYERYQVNEPSESSEVVQVDMHQMNNTLHNTLHTTEERKKERSIKRKYKRKVEQLPDFYNAEPVRDPEPIPASHEEIAHTRQLIMKGAKTEE